MRAEKGITLLGTIFFLALVAVCALIGFKVAPFYVDYFNMRSMLRNMAVEMRSATDSELRRGFSIRANANYLNDYSPQDMTIDRTEGILTLTVEVTKKAPMVAGVSLCMKLDAVGEAPLK
jgi:hypothetical protein